MNHIDLTGRVFARAFKGTLHYYGINRRTFVTVVLWLVGIVACYLLFGAKAVQDELQTFLAFGVLPIFGFTLVLFAWKVFLAPAEIIMERLDDLPAERRQTTDRLQFDLEGANLDAWADTDELSLVQASCLWAGVDPNMAAVGLPQEAIAKRQMLITAMRDNTIRFREAKIHRNHSEYYFRRADLKAYAEKRGLRPNPAYS